MAENHWRRENPSKLTFRRTTRTSSSPHDSPDHLFRTSGGNPVSERVHVREQFCRLGPVLDRTVSAILLESIRSRSVEEQLVDFHRQCAVVGCRRYPTGFCSAPL